MDSDDALKHARRSWHQISENELESDAIVFGQDQKRLADASQFCLEWLPVDVQYAEQSDCFNRLNRLLIRII